MRLIDADKLRNQFTGFLPIVRHEDIIDEIDNAPTEIEFDEPITRVLVRGEEFIKVVTCKECIHNGNVDTDCPFGWRDGYLSIPGDDEYCSYGERKE